ncbi:MAG: SMC family ATPase [Anaerolineales bacterium]|uniref:SMC family ATPase n=1 Tax=Promineifilum sp. TaxID=2664178 RepID=UPI001D678659|nr:SMC family ATPase [Anaerolineales bacterium]MCB8935173.1 SMC family ATPase [Promineifilum sp.]MCO5179096.1 SMC family ATPase [Promineifilum sp.]
MIPIQLSLRNFLSYREPVELDLTGIHLACIAGPNGAGKSSILDAITWALFGKSRVKSDDDLVNRIAAANGAAAEAHFVFELEGAVYRVIRRKAAGKTTELEFHARATDDEADRWQVRTEAKVRETQAEIERLLRMNYDVFTNASFLLQGKADEFTTKTPDKRKEILAEILGVSQWDGFRERATETRKATESEVAALDRQLAEVEAELAQEEELTHTLALAESEAKSATAERDRQEVLVAAARQNRAMADQQRETLKRLVGDLEESNREQQRIESTTAQRRAELAAYHTLIDRRQAIVDAFAKWTLAEKDYNERQQRAEQHAAIVREIHPVEMAIARLETQLEQQTKELEANETRAEQASAELQRLTAQLQEQQERLAHLLQQLGQVSERQAAWQEGQARLQTLAYERRLWEQELIQLEARANEINTLQQEREQLEYSRVASAESLVRLDASLAELSAKQLRLNELSAESAGLEANRVRLKEEMDNLKARIDQLAVETQCPFCGQPLTEDSRPHVLGKLQAEGEELGAQYRRHKSALGELHVEREELTSALKRLSIVEKERQSQQATTIRHETRLQDVEKKLQAWGDGTEAGRLAELRANLSDESEKKNLVAQLETLKSAADEAQRLGREQKQVEMTITRDQTRSEELQRIKQTWEQSGRSALAENRRLLAEKSFAATERARLAELQARLEAVEHDPAALEAARSQRARLAAAPQEHQQLMQADAAIKPLSDALADLEQQHERVVKRVVGLHAECEQSERLLAELEKGVGDLPAAEAELLRLREKVVSANRTAGAAKQRVEVLAVRHADRKKLTTARTALTRRAGRLRQLEEACGRKGVQAMLIDLALPEIEDHANELLDDLTGGEMRVMFETQRASKSKQDNMIETLDIRISDSTGERPYENYSGGEKFRINFAVRLALSRILAHRSGARLRTLVIDEGFGSQDPEGRQRLVEAINAVQDQFACILVITHIDELRDKFPARIDVEKTAAGSHATVVAI